MDPDASVDADVLVWTGAPRVAGGDPSAPTASPQAWTRARQAIADCVQDVCASANELSTTMQQQFQLDHIEVSLNVSAHGKVGFAGSGVGGVGSTSVRVLLKRKPLADHRCHKCKQEMLLWTTATEPFAYCMNCQFKLTIPDSGAVPPSN